MFKTNTNKNIIKTNKQINIPTIAEHNENYEQYQNIQNTESTQRLS